MKSDNKFLWRASIGAVVFLTALCLSPIILTPGRYEPTFAGIPYTLWTSILIAIAIVVVTFIGIYVHPGDDGPEDKQS